MERALAPEIREDQLAVDVLRGRETLADLLESGEPLLGEGAPPREAGSGEITELVIVGVDSRDGRGDRLEREPVVDELPHQLGEGRVDH